MPSMQPFTKTPEEYALLAHVLNAVWPEYSTTAEIIKYDDDSTDSSRFFERFFVKNDAGMAIGYGRYCETWWADSEDQYEIDAMVLPEYRRQGIGALIYDHIMHVLAPRQPKSYLAETREDRKPAVRFLKKRGFESHMRESESELVLNTFDAARYDPLIEKLGKEGIRLMTLPEYQTRAEDWQHKIHALENEIDQDVPYLEEFVPTPFEEYVARFNRPGFDPDGWILAVDEATGELAGMSTIWVHAERSYVDTGITGVTRPFRRRGIARALKARALGYAQTLGKDVIRTDNEENNPMYQLNLQLGFKPIPGWLFFKKTLTP